MTSSGYDSTGLGHWYWMRLQGTTTSTGVIMVYAACVTQKKAQNVTIPQQRRYWKLQNIHTCARKLFRDQLIEESKDGKRTEIRLFYSQITMRIWRRALVNKCYNVMILKCRTSFITVHRYQDHQLLSKVVSK